MGSQQLGGSTAAATERPQRAPLLPTGRSTLQVYRMIKRSETACHDLLMEGDAALRSADIAVRLGIDLFPSPLKKKKENQKNADLRNDHEQQVDWFGSEELRRIYRLAGKAREDVEENRDAGVRMEPLSDDGYATFITEDPDVAGRFGILPKRNRAMKTENEEGDG